VVGNDHGIYGLTFDGMAVPIVTDAHDDFESPAVSPDGRQLVFSRGASPSSAHDLWVMPITGGSARRLTNSGTINYGPAWSPDGRTIAYSRVTGTGVGVWAVSATGGTSVMVAPAASHPTWLGETGALVAVDNTVGDGPLVLLHNGARTVIPGTSAAIEPAVSPDGRWLAFSHWRSDTHLHSLVVIPTGNGAGVEVKSSTLDFQNPSWLPDDSGLLFDTRDLNGASRPSAATFTAAPGLTNLMYLTDRADVFSPVYASTAPPSPGMQPWGGPTTLRHKGSFGVVGTTVAPRRW
jgi:Tol biopolymer transport system component